MELLEPYKVTVFVIGMSGLMLLVQILLADIVAIKLKHTPGFPIEPDHDNFLFRAARAYSNTNETVAIFVLFAIFGMASGASALYLNAFAVTYLAGRLGHMIFYYANVQVARSLAFVVCLIGLIGMFITGLLF